MVEPRPHLTSRELEVLESVANGLSGRQVALELGIAYKTERNHVAHIMEKLHARTLAHAVAVAMSADLISQVPWS